MPRAFDVKTPVATHDPTRTDLNFNINKKLDMAQLRQDIWESMFHEIGLWFYEKTGIDVMDGWQGFLNSILDLLNAEIAEGQLNWEEFLQKIRDRNQSILDDWFDALMGLPKGTSSGKTWQDVYTAATQMRDKADEAFRTAGEAKVANEFSDFVTDWRAAAGSNLVLSPHFSQSTVTRFPLNDVQFSGYSIGEEHHSGLQCWKWVHSAGLDCGIALAPTTRINHIDVTPGEVFTVEAWVHPHGANDLTTGDIRIGGTFTDTSGVQGDTDISYDCPQNGPDMVPARWNKIVIETTVPSGYDKVKFWVKSTANTHAGNTFHIDDVLVREKTDSKKAQVQADWAEFLVGLKSRTGSNLVVDPKFALGNMVARFPFNLNQVFGYSTVQEPHWSGLTSWKWIQEPGAASGFVMNPSAKVDTFQVRDGERFRVEGRLFAPTSNVGVAGAIRVGATFSDSDNALPALDAFVETLMSAITKGSWTKLSATLDVPEGYDTAKFWIIATSTTDADRVFYVDDVAVWDGAAAEADSKAVVAQENIQTLVNNIHTAITGDGSPGSRTLGSVITNLKAAWSAFFDGLNGTSGSSDKLPADVQIVAAAVRSAASTAGANATTAIAAAATADEKAVAAKAAADAAQGTADDAVAGVQGVIETATVQATDYSNIAAGSNFETWAPDSPGDQFDTSYAIHPWDFDSAGVGRYSVVSYHFWNDPILIGTLYHGTMIPSEYGHCLRAGAAVVPGVAMLKTHPTVRQGEKFYVEFWARCDDYFDGGVLSKFRIGYNDENIFLADIPLGASVFTNRREWKFFNIQVEVPQGAYHLNFEIYTDHDNTNTDWVWDTLDDQAQTPHNYGPTHLGQLFIDDIVVRRQVPPEGFTEIPQDKIADLDVNLKALAAYRGSNLIPNGTMEDSNYRRKRWNEPENLWDDYGPGAGYDLLAEYSTEHFRHGTQSIKMWTGDLGWARIELPLSPLFTGPQTIPCTSSDVFQFEAWVYGAPTNTFPAGSGAGIGCVIWPFAADTLIETSPIGQQVGAQGVGTDAHAESTGVWTKISGIFSPPGGSTEFLFTIGCSADAGATFENIWWVDDVALYRVTDSAQALAAANTGITNAALADAKAVSADAKAVAAQVAIDKAAAALKAVIANGPSIIFDGGFENEFLWNPLPDANNGGTRSSEQAHGGTYSWKSVADGSTVRYVKLNSREDRSLANWPTAAARKYAVEVWIYPKGTNSHAAGYVSMHSQVRLTGDTYAYPYITFATSALTKAVWQKLTGTLIIPANAVDWNVYLRVDATCTNGDTFYLDDARLVDITEAYDANVAAVAAQATANTGVTNAATADGKAVTADGKAVAAQGTANTATTTANTATTNLQTVVDGAVQAVDGGTATGAAASTFKTKLQLAWANFWDGLNGTTGATSKLPADVKTVAAAVKSTANTGVTNAATADGKAVTAQTTATRASDVATGNLGAGSNLVADPGVTNANLWVKSGQCSIAVSTEQYRSGPSSLKATITGIGYPAIEAVQNGTQTPPAIPVVPGERYYIECYVKAAAGNVNTKPFYAQFLFHDRIGGAADYTIPGSWPAAFMVTPTTSWQKCSGYVTVPAGVDSLTVYLAWQQGTVGDIYFVDDIILRELTGTQDIVDSVVQAVDGGTATGATISTVKTKLALAWANFWDGLNGTTGATSKLPADVKTVAAAVKSTSGTALTNAATADGKAVTAQSAADGAHTRVEQFTMGGAGNLCTNPGFEDAAGYALNGTIVTTPVRSGSRSMRMTGNGTMQFVALTTTKATQGFVTSGPSRSYYIEVWAYGDNANTLTGSVIPIQVGVWGYTTANVFIAGAAAVISCTADQIGKGAWVKLSGTVILGPDVTIAKATPMIQMTAAATTGNSWYFDDAIVRDITETQTVTDGIVQAVDGGTATGATTSTVKTKLALAWANFWDGLNGTTGATSKLPADVKTVAAAVKSTAGTALTNAATADGKAVTATTNAATAQTTANTATTNLQTVVDATVQAVDGGTATGAAHSTVKDKLVLAWANFWDGLNGTTGATSKLPGDVKTVAAAVKSTAGTALTNAATADGKAVTADGKAVTADGKAVSAQTTANTATTNLQTVVDGAVQAVDGGTATGAAASTFKTKLQLAWANLWDGLNGSSGATVKLPSDVKTVASSVKSVADTASTNATTAIGSASTANTAAGTAQTTANTATTNLQTVVDATVQAVDGGTATGAAHSTVKDKLTLAWANFWDGLNGTTGATSKLPADVKTVAAAVKSTSGTALTNAATADGKAVTADGKAVAAQSLAYNQIPAGTNLCSNPSWEYPSSLYLNVGGGTLSSEQAHTGTKSLKLTGTGAQVYTYVITNATAAVLVACSPGDVFAVEFWVYGKSTNTQTSGGPNAVRLFIPFYDKTVTYVGGTSVALNATTALNGVWTKVSGYATAPANATHFYAYHELLSTVPAGEVYYFDDVVIQRATEGYVADGKAVAAQATANTGVTNAATADGKAVVAQSLSRGILAGGSNIVSNPGFENTTFWLHGNPSICGYSTEQKRSGSRSVKVTHDGASWVLPTLVSDATAEVPVPVSGGDVFACEAWIYGHASNADTTQGAWIQINYQNLDGSSGNASGTSWAVGNAVKGTWTKISATLTLPSTATRINAIWLVGSSLIPAGNVYYWDDPVVRETTATQTVIDGTVQAIDGGTATGAAPSTVKTKLALAWANFWDGLNGTTGATSKLPSDVKTVAAAVKSTAGTALTNAATADGKAVTADGKAVTADGKAVTAQGTANTATTNLQTVVDATVQAVDGGTATGATHSTVKDKLLLAWSKLFDGLNGTTGSTTKLPADAYTAAAAVKANAALGVTNAATADGKAVTADGKAVDITSRVDAFVSGAGNIVTNSGFEDTTQYLCNATYSTTLARSGARSAKLTGNGTNIYAELVSNKTSALYVTSGPWRMYYVEVWVRGDAANTVTGGNAAIGIGVMAYNSANVYVESVMKWASPNDVGTGAWLKVAATLQLGGSTSITKVRPVIQVTNAIPAGNSYYFDDVIVRDVTEGASAQVTADAAATTATTADGKAVAALADAGTAITNAATADGKAVTADGKAVSINTALFGQSTPGSAVLASILPADLTTVGSGFLISKTSGKTYTGGGDDFVLNTYKFKPGDYNSGSANSTDDYTVSTGAGGEITVTAENAGWYMIEVAFGIQQVNQSFSYNAMAALFKNGTLVKVGSSVNYNSIQPLARPWCAQGAFILYLDGDDYVTPACGWVPNYQHNSVQLLESHGGSDTYFSVSLLNRSLA